MKLKHWIRCRILKKHTYDYYSDRCIVCRKQNRSKLNIGHPVGWLFIMPKKVIIKIK